MNNELLVKLISFVDSPNLSSTKFMVLFMPIYSNCILYTYFIVYDVLLYLLPPLFSRNISNNMRVVVTSASCDAKFQRNFKSFVSLCNRLNTVYCLEWSRMELVDVAIHHLKGYHNIATVAK